MNFTIIPILLATVIGTLSVAAFHKPEFSRNIIVKLVLSLLCFVFLFGFFIKICKPAVRYTETGMLYSSSVDIDSTSFDINIIRNYDCVLNKVQKIPLDTIFEKYMKGSEHEGGIFITGDIWTSSYSWGSVRGPSSVLDSLHEVAKSYCSEKILNKDSIGLMMYTSIYQDGSRNFRLFDISKYKERCYPVEKSNFCHYDGKRVAVRTEKQKGFDIRHPEPVGSQGTRVKMISVRQKSDSICHIDNYLKGSSFDKVDMFYAAEDISKLFEVLKFSSGYWAGFTPRDIKSITYNYRTPIVLPSKIDPEPDEINLNYIRFTNPDKIGKIVMEGLRFYVEFPENASFQNIKTVIVGALATTFGTLVLRYLYIILVYLFVSFKEKVSRRIFYSCIVLFAIIIVLIFAMSSYKSRNASIDITENERLYGNDFKDS